MDEATFHWNLGLVLVFVVVPFMLIQGIVFSAPYGKFSKGRTGPWQWTVSKRSAWIIMETPAFLAMFLNFVFFGDAAHQSSTTYRIGFMMYAGHYFNRAFIYPHTLKGGSFSMIVALTGAVYNIFVGYFNGAYVSRIGPVSEETTEFSLILAIGMMLYILGAFINWHSDMLLARLRKPGETGYKIPHGGMFNFVTAANYSGTMAHQARFVFAYSIAYFIPRAHSSHLWYLSKFDSYPQNRKKLIPLVW